MGKIGIGVIGTGFGAKIQVPAFQGVPGCEVVGLAGRDRQRTAIIAEGLRLSKVYDSWEAMIDDDRVTAVSIAVPPALHYEMVMMALRRGKHILCEKPLGLNSVQAQEMAEVADESGVVHMIDFLFRMAPERIRLWELLDTQAIGKISRVNVEWTVRGRAARSSEWCWQLDQASGGGALFAFGVHVIDYLEWLLGPVRAVSAHLSVRGHYRTTEWQGIVAEDTLDTLMLIGNEIPVSISISNATAGGRGHWLSIYGERGALVVGNSNLNDAVVGTALFERDPQTGDLRPIETASMGDRRVADGRVLLVHRLAQKFVGAISTGQPTSPSFKDGWRAQVVMDAVRQAHAERRWVVVPLKAGQGLSEDQARSPR
jgi:predicted dehydrogenase